MLNLLHISNAIKQGTVKWPWPLGLEYIDRGDDYKGFFFIFQVCFVKCNEVDYHNVLFEEIWL